MNNRIVLSLGSNIGDKIQNLIDAINYLKEKISIDKISSVYKTEPMYFKKQDFFYNCAIFGYTILNQDKLLDFVKSIEKKMGREEIFKNGPRIIDIDIIFFNSLKYKSNTLIIPHPDYLNRSFVLYPISEILPDFVLPFLNIHIKDYINNNYFDGYIEKLKINNWLVQ